MEEFKKPFIPYTTKEETSEITQSNPIEKLEKIDGSAILTKPNLVVCPYIVPEWSGLPNDGNNYSFEVLKSGQIINEIKEVQKKAYWTFGRLPENDIELAHPTISRFHAVLQYRPKFKNVDHSNTKGKESKEISIENNIPLEGWFIYDLSSTHGTFLNKQRIPPKVYIRIRVGHILRLGASTRAFILQGPVEDEEPESELTITELKAKHQKELEEVALKKQCLADEAIERAYNEGCSWGMGEDADEETDLNHNPYASTNNEEYFLEDPKKTLRGYFEREGLELIYKCDEMSAGSFVCRVELPIDDADGRPIISEAVHKGKKKDCVFQCALEACRLLDRHGVLRQANQEPLKRKQKLQNSDSDDDEFWDRTGDVARKKERKANININVTLTYEDLIKQDNDIDEQINQIEFGINKYNEQQQKLKAQNLGEGEDLDAFMKNLQENKIKLDKTEIRKLRIEEKRLKHEKQRLERLIKITKPMNLLFSAKTADSIQSQAQRLDQHTVKKQLPMIGKRNQFSKFKFLKANATATNNELKAVHVLNSDEEEVEEDEKSFKIKCEESKQYLDTVSTNYCKETPVENIENNAELKEKKVFNEYMNLQNAYQSHEHTEDIAVHNCKELEEKVLLNEPDLSKTPDNISMDIESNSKKRRHRVRHRGKRQEVDIDDEDNYESPDKYAKWVPPQNQSGDGFTELNKKFGY